MVWVPHLHVFIVESNFVGIFKEGLVRPSFYGEVFDSYSEGNAHQGFCGHRSLVGRKL